MIKVTILNDSTQGLGGGWTFMRNLQKALGYFPEEVQYVNTIEEADICLIVGTSMVNKETVQKVKELGKKLVVRLDNVPRNSRNRNTGTSRLKGYSQQADALVWQCEWAKNYLEDFITDNFEKQIKQVIIYNGVDTDIFKPEGEKMELIGSPKYLYSRFNRDETKNWEVAWYRYQMEHRNTQGRSSLYMVGQFSPEQIEYGFDFFRGEIVNFLGVIPDPEQMAKLYRSVDYLLATYFNDCYSNTYMEAMACGVELAHVDMSGGTPELRANWERKDAFEFNGLKRMGRDYVDLFKSL